MRRLLIVAAAFTVLPAFANAQGRGGMGMARPAMPSAPARSVVIAAAPTVHAAPAVTAHMTAVRVVPRGTSPHGHPTSTMVRVIPRPINHTRPVNQVFAQDQDVNEDSFPTPGLGFDQVHWAAVHPQGTFGRGHHHRSFGAFFPFFDGGFFLTPQTIVEEAPAVDAQVAEETQPEVVEQPAPRIRYYREAAPAPTAQPSAPEAPRESEQYVFVRRDGTIIFAVAYAYENGSVRYITTDGMRRTVALDALDLDATRQFNEQRGLVVRLPA